MGKKNKRNKPYLPDPKVSFQIHTYFDYQIKKAQGQLDKLKHLKSIAVSRNSSVDVKWEKIKEADTVLKKEPGQQKKLDGETLQLLTELYNEWMSILKFIRRAHKGFCEQGMSKQGALDKLVEMPRLDLFSRDGLANVLTTNLRPYILEILSDLSGFAKSTLAGKIKTTKPR